MTKANVTIAACATLLWAGTAQAAGTPQQKCQVAKLKAQGTLQACLKTNSGKVILGRADTSAACQTKFTTALAKADTKGVCRYIDNGDGTVSDLNTGLVWEKKGNLDETPNPTDPHDADNSYPWSTAFATFVGALNGSTYDGSTITGCFASHCDWRVPTIVELQGIVDRAAVGCGSGSACIDPTFGSTQNVYWSATPVFVNEPFLAWFVTFGNGGVDSPDEIIPNGYVRAVRGGL